jgi:hypothetical protein
MQICGVLRPQYSRGKGGKRRASEMVSTLHDTSLMARRTDTRSLRVRYHAVDVVVICVSRGEPAGTRDSLLKRAEG